MPRQKKVPAPSQRRSVSLDIPSYRTFPQPRRRRQIYGYISNVSTTLARVTFLNGLLRRRVGSRNTMPTTDCKALFRLLPLPLDERKKPGETRATAYRAPGPGLEWCLQKPAPSAQMTRQSRTNETRPNSLEIEEAHARHSTLLCNVAKRDFQAVLEPPDAKFPCARMPAQP